MATVIKLKTSASAGSGPTTSQIALGELALNTYDGDLYFKKSVSGTETIVKLAGASASGNATTADVFVNAFTGNGSNRAFTLSHQPISTQQAFATINGIQQHITSYALAGSVLTFTVAPAAGDAVEIRVVSATTTAVSLRDYKSFVYTVGSTTSSISGADDNSVTLAYDSGKVNVYQNGVRLINGSDYTATSGTAVTFTTSLESGDVIEIESLSKASVVNFAGLTPGATVLSTNAANQTIDTFAHATHRTAKYVISATHSTSYHCSEIILIHDGSATHMTEYGSIFTGSSLYTISSDISGSNVRLKCSPTNAGTTVKIKRITVAV